MRLRAPSSVDGPSSATDAVSSVRRVAARASRTAGIPADLPPFLPHLRGEQRVGRHQWHPAATKSADSAALRLRAHRYQ